MKFLFVLLGTLAFVTICKPLIKKAPAVFYALAILLDVLFVVTQYVSLPPLLQSGVFLLVQKCTLALALFIVVMYIGVFNRDSKIRSYFMPIRKELSIMAWFLSLGHMVMYMSAYAERLLGSAISLPANILTSLVISLVLFVLLLILGFTSFDFIKKRMSKQNWKRVQRLSYPFFFLIYFHLLLFLLPPALNGGQTAQISVAIYTVIFVGYAIARIVAVVRARSHADLPEQVPA